ncbi:hypothetical protein IFM89_005592 [Coptis chinensis]|uniref:Uncharacterized protein n=1 Tax=Coptis chinensis TaxID=261450 RepID=A0A835IAS0_9MAGN|nr:hypothetical protein IFM89_005592 [Coptis chinensis]
MSPFICSSGIDGQSRLLEWNKRDGIVERTYIGLRNQSADKLYRIASSNAGGGLSACAKLKFNRDGSLLAVVTNENGIKILGNADGQRLISMAEQWDSEVSESPCVPINVRY